MPKGWSKWIEPSRERWPEGLNEKERPVGHESQGTTSSRISSSNWTSFMRRRVKPDRRGREETESVRDEEWNRKTQPSTNRWMEEIC